MKNIIDTNINIAINWQRTCVRTNEILVSLSGNNVKRNVKDGGGGVLDRNAEYIPLTSTIAGPSRHELPVQSRATADGTKEV